MKLHVKAKDQVIVIDGEEFFLEPGDCAVILPYAEHEGFCRIDNETTKYYCAKLDTRSFIPHGKSALGDEIRYEIEWKDLWG